MTYQTDANGQPVNSVLVCEDMYPVQRELYLGAVVDRSSRRVTFMASTEGGVEIEEVAHNTRKNPESHRGSAGRPAAVPGP